MFAFKIAAKMNIVLISRDGFLRDCLCLVLTGRQGGIRICIQNDEFFIQNDEFCV